MSGEAKTIDLVARLRARLITVPKPGSKPYEPTYPISHTYIPGETHKPGESAGIQMVNVNLNAASSMPSKFMAQEFIYEGSPLEWEAAAEIERLRAALIQYGTHESPCLGPCGDSNGCTCGLEAILEAAHADETTATPLSKTFVPKPFGRKCNRCGKDVWSEQPMTETVVYCSIECADD